MISIGVPVEQLPSGNMSSSQGTPSRVVQSISAVTLQATVLGMADGADDGKLEGLGEGPVEGVADGAGEGAAEGTDEGVEDGSGEGADEGAGEGGLEGADEGSGEGGVVGNFVGGSVGLLVGNFVGGSVGLLVGRFVTDLNSLGRKRCQKAASSSNTASLSLVLSCLSEAASFSKATLVRRRAISPSTSALTAANRTAATTA